MLRKCQFRWILAALVLMCILGFFITYHGTDENLPHCFMNQMNDLWTSDAFSERERLEDIMLSEKKPISGRSIFFLETSCNQRPPTQLNLTARQACAIESAALHNPNFDVFVLFATPVYQFKNKSTLPLIEAILSYPNVHIRYLNLWTYAAGTPLYDWLKDGQLFKSRYVITHISDFLRYLTLWRWGGTYLDMDTINLRSLEDLPPNYTGAESDTDLAAGVMNFSPNGFGHEIAEQCLLDFQRNFDGYKWGKNGPGVITRVLQSICGTKNIELMLDKKRCMGFQVYQTNAFYAISYENWFQFFDPNRVNDVLERLKNSYVAHVWNNFSKKQRLKLNEETAYLKLAQRNCPKVIAATVDYF